MENKSKNNATKKMQSIKTKIIVPVCLCVSVSIAIIVTLILSMAKTQILNMTEENMSNLSVAYGKLLDTELTANNKEPLSIDTMQSVLGGISLDGIASSYAYLVAADGTMLYHPTAEKIGSSVENSVVLGLVDKIKAGEIPEPKVVSYDFKGTIKYAGYYVSSIDKSILVVTADQAEILKPVNSLVINVCIWSVVFVLAILVILYFIANSVTKPIKRVTTIIKDISDFNFKNDHVNDMIMKRKDETGEMARAVTLMRDNLRKIVLEINDVSGSLTSTASDLQKIAINVNEYSSDNSATSEELAASMEETSATTETIDSNIALVNRDITSIKEYTENGFSTANEILDRAEQLKATTQSASEKTKDIYATVKKDTETAIENAKAINQINELTEAINQISTQTSLLSLNASIEAARAGESGRGFAVVANEIGNLANQSSKTVQEITDIVKVIYDSVNAMSDCLSKTLDFLGTAILSDYQNFIDVSNRYSNDAHVVHTSMQDINVSVETLEKSINDITASISGINVTIAEAASGVTDIAGKTSDIVSMSAKTKDKVEDNNTYSERLKDIVNMFHIN